MEDLTSLYHTKLQANKQKHMCKNAHSIKPTKTGHQLDFILILVLNTHVKQQSWHNCKQKNIAEVSHILKFLPLPFP